MERKLSEGVVGSKLVEYFSANANGIPVHVEYLGHMNNNVEVLYRITFDDETVSDWKVTFESPTSVEIESADCYNQVI